MEINLSENEKKIFNFLRDINCKYNLNTVMRVAGGWVRDKCLSKESHDIDIALDNMTGRQFTEFVSLETKSDFCVIEQNPEQSKHLETARINIFGQSIDFVNLRDESFGGAYDKNRILTENRFGSPLIDAQRRDFTINSLFYNINTFEIEDYVGGLADLGLETNQIVLRTPLDPVKTLLDDPLRLLRGMRFLSRFENAKLDSIFIEAMKNSLVQDALVSKVSMERIGDELIGVKENGEEYKLGILNGDRVEEVIKLMYDVGILEKILYVDRMKKFYNFNMSQKNNHHKYDVFNHTLKLMSNIKNNDFVKTLSNEKQSLMLIVSLLHDIGKLDPEKQQVKEDGTYSYIGHELSSLDVVTSFMKKLKRSTEHTEYVAKIVGNHMKPHSEGWGTDKALRRFIMEYTDSWQETIVHAQMDLISSGTERTEKEILKYKKFIERGLELKNNNEVPKNKPLISGHVIMSIFPDFDPKTGYIKKINDILMDMKLDDPTLTEEDLLKEVHKIRETIGKEEDLRVILIEE